MWYSEDIVLLISLVAKRKAADGRAIKLKKLKQNRNYREKCTIK